MQAIWSILRWVFVVLFGMAALGALFSGAFLGFLVMAVGCAIIAPPGGRWLASKIGWFQGSGRQGAIGFVFFL